MNTLSLEALATSVSFYADNICVRLSDGRKLGGPLAYFPRLAKATSAQRKRYLKSGGGIGLHWHEIDEDISVPALLAGNVDRSVQSRKKVRKAA
jgi:hypothetical protein